MSNDENLNRIHDRLFLKYIIMVHLKAARRGQQRHVLYIILYIIIKEKPS
jgi:hypothetical protein